MGGRKVGVEDKPEILVGVGLISLLRHMIISRPHLVHGQAAPMLVVTLTFPLNSPMASRKT